MGQRVGGLRVCVCVCMCEKECFGGEMGGVLCTYIAPKGVCDGGVKNRGWARESGQKETPSGQQYTPCGQKA